MHIDETEGPRGLYEEAVEEKPRLSHAVDRLRADHVVLLQRSIELIGAAAVPTAQLDEPAIREVALDLGRQVERHQRRGLDLIHELYSVDVGSGE
jgi:hypothetical protein